MANIRNSKIVYQTDGAWIYIRSISSLEFDYHELDTRWVLRLLLKGPDADGLYDQQVKKFDTEPFAALNSRMDLAPVIKVDRSEVGEAWESGRISVEIRLYPLDGQGAFTSGYYELYEISPETVIG